MPRVTYAELAASDKKEFDEMIEEAANAGSNTMAMSAVPGVEVERNPNMPTATDPSAAEAETDSTNLAVAPPLGTLIDTTNTNIFEACRQLVQEADKCHQFWIHVYFRGFFYVLRTIRAYEWEKQELKATFHDFDAILQTTILDGTPKVTEETQRLLKEFVIYQVVEYLKPHKKMIESLDGLIDKRIRERWDVDQMIGTIQAIEEGKGDVQALEDLKDRLQLRILDDRDLLPRYIAIIDNFFTTTHKQYQIWHDDWVKLLRPFDIHVLPPLEAGDNFLFSELQNWLEDVDGRVRASVEKTCRFLFLHRLYEYILRYHLARHYTETVPGYKEYQAMSKEERDPDLLEPLPEYQSLEKSPMAQEAVMGNFQLANWEDQGLVKDMPIIEWSDDQPGRSVLTVFKAFRSIRGHVKAEEENKEKADSARKSVAVIPNPNLEQEFRAVLNLLEPHPGFSQLPTLEHILMLYRAWLETGGLPCAKRRRLLDKMQSPCAPVTVHSLDEHIRQWEEIKFREQQEQLAQQPNWYLNEQGVAEYWYDNYCDIFGKEKHELEAEAAADKAKQESLDPLRASDAKEGFQELQRKSGKRKAEDVDTERIPSDENAELVQSFESTSGVRKKRNTEGLGSSGGAKQEIQGLESTSGDRKQEEIHGLENDAKEEDAQGFETFVDAQEHVEGPDDVFDDEE